MQEPSTPPDEARRLASLRALNILDTAPEERFQRIVRLAAALFRTPIALVSLVDAERQWFKASHGLSEKQTQRCVSFCGHAILGNEPLIVEDASCDPRFSDNPLVTGAPHIRFYAGQALAAADGSLVGTLCVIDRKPRTLTEDERNALRDFALMVENEFNHGRVHHALETLRESESHAAAILQTALDCIISIDHYGNVLEFNPAAEQTFGYAREDALGKELASLIIPPYLRDAHRRGLKHFLSTGEASVLGKRIETNAMHADGTEFPVELAITKTYRGGETAFTAYLRDITERKETLRDFGLQHDAARTLAEAIEPTEAMQRILKAICRALDWSFGALWWVEPSMDWIDSRTQRVVCKDIWCDPDKTSDVFIQASRSTRFPRGIGLPGRVWATGSAAWIRDVREDNNFPRHLEAVQAGLHAALGFPIRSRGEVLGVMEFFSPSIRDPNASMLRMLEAIGNQIGQFIERKAGEKRLQQLTTELDAIFNLSPDGFFAFNRDGVQSYINRSLIEMLGCKKTDLEKLTERDFDDLLKKQCEPGTPYPAIADASDGETITLRLARPRPMTLTRSVKVLRSQAKETLGKVVYFRNITLEAEIDRMKTEFLSTAAHELRTPMASIHGFSELLLNREYDKETRRDLIETIHRQSRQLVHMVNELLDLARIEARQGKDFNIQPQALGPIVRGAVKSFTVPGSTHDIRVKLPRRTLIAPVDREKFHQALLNVLANASKYSQPSTPIEIECRLRHREETYFVGVVIRDHGIGMTPEQASRIFERFYRVDSSGSIPGTGLGMSLVKEIMDIHHGEVEIVSKPGQGTEVTLWLPQSSREGTRTKGQS